MWSAPLPFYKSNWAPSTNPWGTAVYVRLSFYFPSTGTYICIVNLANKTVMNTSLLFQYEYMGYLMFVWTNTMLAVATSDTLYFFNGMTGSLVFSKTLPTSCSYPLTIQSSAATNCMYYASATANSRCTTGALM